MGTVFGASASEVKGRKEWRFAQRMGRAVINTLYPPQCLACEQSVQETGTLCGPCWAQTPFIEGLACDTCGLPVLGDPTEGVVQCEDCLTTARPWSRGRAALSYGATARQLVLALKYGDRHDIAAPAGRWLARKAAPLIRPDTCVVPVPLHRWRLFKRRFNQSALLAHELAQQVHLNMVPDALIRTRFTGTQDGRSRRARFANMQGAIHAHPRRSARLAGRHVLLVDDVMTSGATLAAAAEACFAAGADDVDVVVLARVGHEDAA